ncbi:uncharacterized protein LOC110842946 [Folsomia candida]|uniref:uncharacterized protein LOC110842946 n=1 Tax=Folsomia candida TaxID=158441 RepID=UPI000B908139|nr:uncharacterized protein LOC110842946 [Folsomia candida]
MKASLFLLFGVVLLTGRQDVVEGQAISGGMTIGDATEFCERAVPAHCVSTTCPLFCNTLRSRRQRTLCNSGCTPSGRCLLRPVAAGDDPTNRILDAQNRDQLFACIAEKRDPAGSTTGRRMTTWEKLRSPSFKKATRI